MDKVDARTYATLLDDIKGRIQRAQLRAALSASREMIALYWDIGRELDERQRVEGWGTAVIPRLARDLNSSLPEIKGFSERNLKRMIRFFREYPWLVDEVPQAVAQLRERPAQPAELANLLLSLPWGHNFILIEKLRDLELRRWYARQTVAQGWNRDQLTWMIKGQAHARQGAATTNFELSLPEPHSSLAHQVLKDPYVFDFLTLQEPFHERELEASLMTHLQTFLLELGVGFAFVGRQYHISLGEHDFLPGLVVLPFEAPVLYRDRLEGESLQAGVRRQDEPLPERGG